MKLSNVEPSNWKELQDYVALILKEAGYDTKSPCEINPARGKVEVDVLVNSPDELIKKIICECKFWNTNVPKEKVYAFRMVVQDSGAAVGLLISKKGFQSGAIETAKYSNVRLVTWEEFLSMLSYQWTFQKLRNLKKQCFALQIYMDPLDCPYKKLNDNAKIAYVKNMRQYLPLLNTCLSINVTTLLSCQAPLETWYHCQDYTTIMEYLRFLESEIKMVISEFKKFFPDYDILENCKAMNGMEYINLI